MHVVDWKRLGRLLGGRMAACWGYAARLQPPIICGVFAPRCTNRDLPSGTEKLPLTEKCRPDLHAHSVRARHCRGDRVRVIFGEPPCTTPPSPGAIHMYTAGTLAIPKNGKSDASGWAIAVMRCSRMAPRKRSCVREAQCLQSVYP